MHFELERHLFWALLSGAPFWMVSVGAAEHCEGWSEGNQAAETRGPDPWVKLKLKEVVFAFAFPRSTVTAPGVSLVSK